MARQTWVQDPKTGKLIPKEEYVREGDYSAYIHGDIDSFVSPIDGRVITDRSHLRSHNKEHGVTNSADYSHEFLLKRSGERLAKQSGRTEEDRRDRREMIIRELEKQ